MNLIETIQKLKKEKNAIILAHNYQRPEIQDIADFLGDSFGLSKKASETSAEIIVFCGVRFMAETAKILSPDKIVLLPRKEAGCPLADMATAEDLIKLKGKYKDVKVVSYVNTTAEIKAESDICCTSANAVKVVKNIKAEKIIFTPDKNLADYVSRFTNQEIIPWDGYCYVHTEIQKEDVIKAKTQHPNAVVIVHPECEKEVIDASDEVLSTGGMVRFAKESKYREFLIGTEQGIIYRLKKGTPDKEFYPIRKSICRDMKLTKLKDVYLSLVEERYKIEIPENIQQKAKKSLSKMLEYG